MSAGTPESPDLLQRLMEEETKYASHHRVVYELETLKAIALLAKTLPYLRGDAYETALDLLDEAGAEVRVRKLVSSADEIPSVGLRELAPVVSRKTGRSLGDFIQ